MLIALTRPAPTGTRPCQPRVILLGEYKTSLGLGSKHFPLLLDASLLDNFLSFDTGLETLLRDSFVLVYVEHIELIFALISFALSVWYLLLMSIFTDGLSYLIKSKFVERIVCALWSTLANLLLMYPGLDVFFAKARDLSIGVDTKLAAGMVKFVTLDARSSGTTNYYCPSGRQHISDESFMG